MGKRKIWEKLKIEKKKEKPKITYESRWTKRKYETTPISIFDLFNLEKFIERSHLATIAGASFMILAAFIILVTNIKLISTFCAILVAFALMLKLHGMKSKDFIYNFIPGILIAGWVIIFIFYLAHQEIEESFYILISGAITLFATYTFFFSMREK